MRMAQLGSQDWRGWLRRRDWRSWLPARSARRSGVGLGEDRRRRPWARAVAIVAAAIVILPLGYLGYCIATLPLDGGLAAAEPAAPALIVEADDGTAFASRGVF